MGLNDLRALQGYTITALGDCQSAIWLGFQRTNNLFILTRVRKISLIRANYQNQ
jgi:hypothetical protein